MSKFTHGAYLFEDEKGRLIGSDVRVGTAQREEAVDVLNEALSSGRLNISEWTERIKSASVAETVGDLKKLLDDLPYFPMDKFKHRDVLPSGAYDKWMEDAALVLEEKKKTDGKWLKLSVLTVNFVIAPLLCVGLLWEESRDAALMIAAIIMAVFGFITAAVFFYVQNAIEENYHKMGMLLEFMRKKMDATFGEGR